VITVIGDRADLAAEEPTRRWRAGVPRALEGIPFGVNDVIDVEGVPTTAGTKIYDGRIAQRSAEVVRRAEEAGAIAVTKDATTEFAIGGPYNPAFGPVRNPWDTSRWTGGSSTGSAASVAARCYPLAIGTDAGGSIRIPSAWCGLTGLKPTTGAVSRTGVVPLSWVTETMGPLGRSARDVALFFEVLRGHDPADPRSVQPPASRPRAEGVSGLRLGVPVNYFLDFCDSAVRSGYDSLLRY
jgi:aspartyl-tRNA(Asn)/glutamyl-tRNA(Gln) amidotransferase subunit A